MAVINSADNLATVIDLTKKVAHPIESEPIHFAVVPNDCSIKSLEDYQFLQPRIKESQVILDDVASFIAYYNLFKDGHSRIFANPASMYFNAVLDYHCVGDGPARHLKHEANLTCKKTDEWNVWTSNNNKQMDQTNFAIFIEDNLPDIVIPSGAGMLEVARQLKAKKDVDFASDINLANGEVKFKYQETIQGRVGGGDIEVPEAFTLRFPVLLNAAPKEIVARLRWRITSDKKLMFWYTLVRANKLLEAIKVKKADLLATLRENRAKHNKIFLEACGGYRAAAIRELDNMLAEAKAGKKIRRSVSLIEPADQTKDYDRVIRMMEMSVDDEITLDEHDFSQYVLDQWGWKKAWSASNMAYSSTLMAQPEDYS